MGNQPPIYILEALSRGTTCPPCFFGLIFNCLLLALRVFGATHRTVSGLCTSACGFADDFVPCTGSAEAMIHLLDVAADFCKWSCMRVKLEASVATELSTAGILYQGTPYLVHLLASESFPCTPASWPAPAAALDAGNGRRDPPRIWRQRRPRQTTQASFC
jgi:hypothetical protein